MADEYKINLMYYCDLAIAKLRDIKLDYEKASDETDLRLIRQVSKKIKDSKYLFNEIQAIVTLKKTELTDLHKGHLDG